MGRAARANPRSPDGGKPSKYCSFHRCIRAVRVFGDDREGFEKYISDKGEHAQAAMRRIWSELHPEAPKPLITLHSSIPDVIERDPQPEKRTTRRLEILR